MAAATQRARAAQWHIVDPAAPTAAGVRLGAELGAIQRTAANWQAKARAVRTSPLLQGKATHVGGGWGDMMTVADWLDTFAGQIQMRLTALQATLDATTQAAARAALGGEEAEA